MSEENVAIIRASNDAWNKGDMSAFEELLDPEVIVQTVGNWPEPGPHVGREAVMRFYRGLRAAFDEDKLRETSDYVYAADRVVVRLAMETVGHGPPGGAGGDDRVQRPQSEDPERRILLGPRGSPRSCRATEVALRTKSAVR
jgi:hypothetical protein